jgi:hypothetical protein
VTESFLHYIWQLQYFDKHTLQTSAGESLQILNPGNHNTDAGPDFSQARIKIGELEWRGSIEIHINASGWIDHQHHTDEAYEKVILHVVWQNDKRIIRSDRTLMPTLELKDRVESSLYEKFKTLYTSVAEIPCSSQWQSVPDIHKFAMLDRVLAHRLDAKALRVKQLLSENNNNWQETLYQLLCKNFGFHINAEPMFRLAQLVPYTMLLKHLDKPLQVEALLYGAAGFLEADFGEEYPVLLKREYTILRNKYQLEGRQMNVSQWRFLRLRPANFPTVRIAQFAALICATKNLFSLLLEVHSYKEFVAVLQADQSAYWHSHYQFGKLSKTRIPSLGQSSIENMILNTFVPLLTAYGRLHDEQSYIDRAIVWLQQGKAENNNIIRQWKMLDYSVKTAFDSQALLELYKNFCMKRRCLACTVGAYLIRN